MPTTVWTNKRLGRLYQRYNRRYWNGRLPNYVVSSAAMKYAGQCFRDRHHICIDINRHKTDGQVRSTVLHEMAHAASTGLAHGYKFWAQIERLLRQGAPINVGFSEAPGVGDLTNAVPTRYPLARKLMNKMERKRQKIYAQARPDSEFKIDEDYIAERFEDAAIAKLPWKDAVIIVGQELGLLDVGGKPRTDWAKKVIAKNKESFLRLRNSLIARDKLRERLVQSPVGSLRNIGS